MRSGARSLALVLAGLLPPGLLQLACDEPPPASTAPASTAPRPARASQPSQRQARAALVFLGDSLTAGRGLDKAEALPARIQQRLDAAGLPYRAINGGRSGDTTAGGLSRLDWYFEAAGEVGALVIGLGSNDAMRGLPLATMEGNLRSIIRRTRERAPGAKIFLWALETFPNMGPQYAGEYAAVFPRVAHEEKIILIPFPLRAVAGQPELNQADGIHPTAEGTRMVADDVWSSLKPHL